jgi:hypothetical protein
MKMVLGVMNLAQNKSTNKFNKLISSANCLSETKVQILKTLPVKKQTLKKKVYDLLI